MVQYKYEHFAIQIKIGKDMASLACTISDVQSPSCETGCLSDIYFSFISVP